MSNNAITVENLGKSYLVGHNAARTERYTALRDVIARNARDLARKTRDMIAGRPIIQGDSVEEFWALKDVSFEVKRGETLGIIGRNGAGKSTLLKILSRITEPTTGRITLNGRVASLLEVGTGFHPELSGRENIFLNGAILGMTRGEIQRKFDEIVAFAEVENFLDTPVKRYSSGMYVRLAFAVAAHLEPEILVVDEVLAVGDAQFQKKCLGKMGDVASEGRTVLFVSHNMAAVAALCGRGLLLHSGGIRVDGIVTDAISSYLQGPAQAANKVNLVDHPNRASGMNALLTGFSISTQDGAAYYGEPVDLVFRYSFPEPVVTPQFCVSVSTMMGVRVFTLISDYQESDIPSRLVGEGEVSCRIHSLPLMPGGYLISIRLWVPGQKLDDIDNVTQLTVEWLDRSDRQTKWTSGHGSIYVDAAWTMNRKCDPNEYWDSRSGAHEVVNV